MSELGSPNMVHRLVAEFVQSMRTVEGVEKLVNLTGERLMKCSEEQDFEETLFQFYVENLVPTQSNLKGFDYILIKEVVSLLSFYFLCFIMI